MSGKAEHGLLRDRRGLPSTSSMDDWYLEVCKRNVNKLSIVGMQQPSDYRLRSGSLKNSVTFLTGKWRALLA